MNKRNFLKCIGVALAAPSVLLAADKKDTISIVASSKYGFGINGGGNTMKASTLNKIIKFSKDGDSVRIERYNIKMDESIDLRGRHATIISCNFDGRGFSGDFFLQNPTGDVIHIKK